jgi:hypothetical protein
MDYMAQNGDATDGRKLVKWSPPIAESGSTTRLRPR